MILQFTPCSMKLWFPLETQDHGSFGFLSHLDWTFQLWMEYIFIAHVESFILGGVRLEAKFMFILGVMLGEWQRALPCFVGHRAHVQTHVRRGQVCQPRCILIRSINSLCLTFYCTDVEQRVKIIICWKMVTAFFPTSPSEKIVDIGHVCRTLVTLKDNIFLHPLHMQKILSSYNN